MFVSNTLVSKNLKTDVTFLRDIPQIIDYLDEEHRVKKQNPVPNSLFTYIYAEKVIFLRDIRKNFLAS